ncbi:hypothetical protein L6164_004822 [Bauhinia variegata]|uniref:Uncharacterized protein n=1 Tax=Bauhinia variegata TaxID=167791 RepID=A0ACB9PUV1_BAUVA|nr:hypothetical protein L6164_004822 [Bauhinia variegata]
MNYIHSLAARSQNRNPNARATKEANAVGTNTVASDVGLGAGASAADTADTAIKTTIITVKSFIFSASISEIFPFRRATQTSRCLSTTQQTQASGLKHKRKTPSFSFCLGLLSEFISLPISQQLSFHYILP